MVKVFDCLSIVHIKSSGKMVVFDDIGIVLFLLLSLEICFNKFKFLKEIIIDKIFRNLGRTFSPIWYSFNSKVTFQWFY